MSDQCCHTKLVWDRSYTTAFCEGCGSRIVIRGLSDERHTEAVQRADPNGPEGDRFMAWWNSQDAGLGAAYRMTAWNAWLASQSRSEGKS